eukprot:g66146.t1
MVARHLHTARRHKNICCEHLEDFFSICTKRQKFLASKVLELLERPFLSMSAVAISVWLVAIVAQANVEFLAFAPARLIPGRSHAIPVTCFGNASGVPADGLHRVEARLQLRDEITAAPIMIQSVASDLFIEDGQGTTQINFAVLSSVVPKDYEFVLVGPGFETSTTISVGDDGFGTYFETDKPIYKPGETVRIWLLTLTERLRPLPRDVKVEVVDPSTYTVSRWLATTDAYGTLLLDLPLPTEPLLGTWTLKALDQTYNTLLATSNFKVDQYTLPLFKVEVSADQDSVASRADQPTILSGEITATYPYGEGVSGEAYVTVTQDVPQWYYGGGGDAAPWGGVVRGGAKMAPDMSGPESPGSGSSVLASSSLPIENGKTTFRLELSGATLSGYGNLKIQVAVAEQATGRKETGETVVPMSWSEIRMELIGEAEALSPGLPFTVMASCTNVSVSSAPCPDVDLEVSVEMQYEPTGDPKKSELPADGDPNSVQPSDGVERIKAKMVLRNGQGSWTVQTRPGLRSAYFTIDQLSPDTSGIDQPPYYQNSPYFAQFFPAMAYSPSSTYLRLEQLTPDDVVDPTEAVSFGLELFALNVPNDPLTAQCLSLSHNDVLWTAQLPLEKASTPDRFFATFSVPPAGLFPDLVKVLCWLRRPGSGEIVADYLPVLTQLIMPNGLTVTPSVEKTEPGQTVKFDISSASGDRSRILLSAVDVSVFNLVGGGSRLNPKQVLSWDGNLDSQKQPSNSDATSTLNAACGVYLSNALIPQQDYWNMFGRGDVNLEDEAPVAPPVANRGPENAGGALPPGAVAKTSAAAPGPGGAGGETVKVRKFFPETWINTALETDDHGMTQFQAVAPDSVTTWSVQAMALSQKSGLGFPGGEPEDLEVTVSLPFFVQLNLPYSCIKGETLELIAAVYNYLSESQNATLTISPSDYFAISLSPPVDNHLPQAQDDKSNLISQLNVKPGGVGAVKFYVTPLSLGDLELQVTVTSPLRGDSMIRTLKVLPPGFPQEDVHNLFLDLSANVTDETDGATSTTAPEPAPGPYSESSRLEIQLPADTVEGSVRAFFSVTGNILGQAMSNLDRLVTMPFGCGEQTIISFSPNTFVLNYLLATSSNDQALMEKAKKNMKLGYMRELTFKHSDGSYSAFGENDPSGSSWLTAFVAKTYAAARPHIFIDPQSLADPIAFLVRSQATDGSFPQIGQVIHTELYGGMFGPVSHSAFVVIALVEAPAEQRNKETQAALSRGLPYLVDQVHQADSLDTYALALITYALVKLEDNDADFALDLLLERATRQGSEMHWSYTPPSTEPPCPGCWCPTSTSADVETTSYALLALIGKERMAEAVPTARWLLNQRNSLGGYHSTQDTVMALQALSAFAILTASVGKPVAEVSVTPSGLEKEVAHVSVTEKDFDLLQTVLLSSLPDTLEVKAVGTGRLAAQLAIRYNVREPRPPSNFKVTVQYNEKASDAAVMSIQVCGWSTTGEVLKDMVMISCGLFTGYEADSYSLDNLRKDGLIKRFEAPPGDRTVHLYLESLDTAASPTCFSFSALRQANDAQPQPATSTYYLYIFHIMSIRP